MVRLILVILALSSGGCQSVQTVSSALPKIADISVAKGSGAHLINVAVDEDLRNLSSSINFSHHVRSGVQYIKVSGSLKSKSGNRFLRNKTVSIEFLDQEGHIVQKGKARITVSRSRPPVRPHAKYSLKFPYSPKFAKCVMNLEI